MGRYNFEFEITRIAQMLGLEHKNFDPSAQRMQFRCPFCDDTKYHLNANNAKNVYRCSRCGEGGSALQLYALLRYGGTYTEEAKAQALKDIRNDLGLDYHLEVKRKNITGKIQRDCKVAADEVLHATYSQLMAIPHFALGREHKENLAKRGFSKETMKQNGYCTFPGDLSWVKKGRYFADFDTYESEVNKFPALKQMGKLAIAAGMHIANNLMQKGCQLEGVPGFFKLNDIWCYRYTEGMGIPVRNMKGEIVCLQVRTNSKTRYLSISSSGLPYGCSPGGRIHFPLQNAEYSKVKFVDLTEGPLKGDAAVHLSEKPSAVIAILGVNNTGRLSTVLSELVALEVEGLRNMLDMDKLTKITVMNGSLKIKDIVKQAGMRYRQVCWDDEYAGEMADELLSILSANNIKAEISAKDVFCKLALLAKTLHDKHLEYKTDWNDATKGIDDYLLYLRSR